MNLSDIVASLGLAEVARRAGVSVTTLKGWLARGASKRGAEKLATIIRRHVAGKKAAATRKRIKEKFPEFRESLPLPPEAYVTPGTLRDGYLSEGQVMPSAPPIKTKKDLDKARRRAGYSGSSRVNTNKYIGEAHWVTIGKSVLDVEMEELGNEIADVWEGSSRIMCHVRFLLFRYIPHNPIYEGGMIHEDLVNKQGKWVDIWLSTHVMGDKPASFNERGRQSVIEAVEVALGWAVKWAYSRVIWLEAMQIRLFDHKADLPTNRQMMRRKIR